MAHRLRRELPLYLRKPTIYYALTNASFLIGAMRYLVLKLLFEKTSSIAAQVGYAAMLHYRPALVGYYGCFLIIHQAICNKYITICKNIYPICKHYHAFCKPTVGFCNHYTSLLQKQGSCCVDYLRFCK